MRDLRQVAQRPHSYFAIPDYPKVLNYVEAVRLAVLHDALDQIATYAAWQRAEDEAEAARQAEIARSRPSPVRAPTPASATGGGGCCTQEQFARLAQCESGGLNQPSPWRTGWFGIEAGYPIGGLSLADQEAWVERIYAAHGPSAWGCAAAFG